MPQLDRLIYILIFICIFVFIYVFYYIMSMFFIPFIIRNSLVRCKLMQYIKVCYIYMYYFKFKFVLFLKNENFMFYPFLVKKYFKKVNFLTKVIIKNNFINFFFSFSFIFNLISFSNFLFSLNTLFIYFYLIIFSIWCINVFKKCIYII